MSTRDPDPGTPGRDPGDEADVTELHAAIRREREEPTDGFEPVPWWLWAGAVIAIFFGGFYLGRHSGTFSTIPHQGYVPIGVPGSEAQAGAVKAAVDGSKIYASRCASCHQPDAKGVPGAFPPLAGSEWAKGAPETMIRIVLDGMQGQVSVGGATFNGAMPAWKAQLSDEEIAAVISYERSLPGNGAGPVTAEAVAALRKELASRTTPWTAAELEAAAGGP
jgi:mono/diheme cytochrome c family protein